MRALGLFLVLLLSACSSVRVTVDHDSSYAFGPPRTYAWKEDAGKPADSELQQRRIVSGVDAALAARGYQRVEQDPALLVWTEVEMHRELRSSPTSVGVGFGHPFGWGAFGYGTTYERLEEETLGNLVITIADAAAGHTVWRAEGIDVLTEYPRESARAVQDTIDKAFERFPPKG